MRVKLCEKYQTEREGICVLRFKTFLNVYLF